MSKKLYISALVLSGGFGLTVLVWSVVAAVHDSHAYRSLPDDYRSAITKLEDGWFERELPEGEYVALRTQRDLWIDQGKMPSWFALEERGLLQETSTLAEDSEGDGFDELIRAMGANEQDTPETLFSRCVPRWGTTLHQREPIAAVALSMVAFVPLILLIASACYVRWLRTPAGSKEVKGSLS